MNDANYPYRKHLYCAKCGYRLERTYAGGRYCWTCSGKVRFSNTFCSGVSIPDEVVRQWGTFSGDRYISETIDRGRVVGFEYEDGGTWKQSHKKKKHQVSVPELTTENYPYKDRIYCKYCGSRLRRLIANDGRVWWICDNSSRNGKSACRGIRVPDDKLHSIINKDEKVYIGKEIINGRECYGYSSKPDTAAETD